MSLTSDTKSAAKPCNDENLAPSNSPRKSRHSQIVPAGLRGPDAAIYCGISSAAWDRLVSAGKTPAPIRLGGCVLWARSELDAWLSAGCPDRSTWEALKKAEVGVRA